MLVSSALVLLVSSQASSAHGIRPSTGHVLVVGSGGFPSIALAVTRAEDGDTLLVKSGSYSGFVISNKSLCVVADAGATVDVQASITVINLAAGKTVSLAGFTIHGSTNAAALVGASNAGSLRIEECTLLANDAQGAARFDASSDVALTQCSLYAGRAEDNSVYGNPGDDAWPAIYSASSSIAIQDCLLVGGTGGRGGIAGPTDGGPGGRGGDGLLMSAGFAFVSGCDLRGGAGGAGGYIDHCQGGSPPGPGGTGGGAIHVFSSTSSPTVAYLDSALTAGRGGPGGSGDDKGCWSDGAHGAAGVLIDAAPGEVDGWTGEARSVVGPRIAREGETATFHCHGLPGDDVQLLAAEGTAFVYAPQSLGVQLIPLATSVPLASGTIPAGGVLDLQVPLAGIRSQSARIFVQAYFTDAGDQEYAATQIALLELDGQY